MSFQQLTESSEMYLKAIVETSAREKVPLSHLAERLNVTAVSANEMGAQPSAVASMIALLVQKGKLRCLRA